MANFGESFSRSFISGYGAGKAIKDDWAAGEYADDVEKQNKLHDEAVEKAGPSKAEDFQKYEGEKKTALEENRKAFMGSDEMSPATEDWVPTRAEHDALGKNEKFQSATKGLADTAKYESDRAKAISDADAALVKGTREAQKKFYGRTGNVEKLAKMQKDDVWVERLMNPEKGKAFLLDYYNKNMAPEGTTFAAGPNGNLVQYDAQGRIVNDNIPMPSKAEMRQMMAQAYGMEKLFDGDTSIYKMLVDQDISRGKTALERAKLNETIRNNDVRNANYAARTAVQAMGKGSGSGGSGGVSKMPQYISNGDGTSRVLEYANGPSAGTLHEDEKLITSGNESLKDLQAVRKKALESSNSRITYMYNKQTLSNAFYDTESGVWAPTYEALAKKAGIKAPVNTPPASSTKNEKPTVIKKSEKPDTRFGEAAEMMGAAASQAKGELETLLQYREQMRTSGNQRALSAIDDVLAKKFNMSSENFKQIGE